MTPFRLALDTSALSELLDERKQEQHRIARSAFERLVARAADRGGARTVLRVPALVAYEARRGWYARGNTRRTRALDDFLDTYTQIVDFDDRAATEAARLWAKKKEAGKTAGEIDLMILATAIAHECSVVTGDSRFPDAPGTSILTWKAVHDTLANGHHP